jgi:hypothetical protein
MLKNIGNTVNGLMATKMGTKTLTNVVSQVIAQAFLCQKLLSTMLP